MTNEDRVGKANENIERLKKRIVDEKRRIRRITWAERAKEKKLRTRKLIILGSTLCSEKFPAKLRNECFREMDRVMKKSDRDIFEGEYKV